MQKRGGNLIGFSFNGISSSTYGITAKSVNRPLLSVLRKRELVIPGRHGAYDFGDNTFESRIIEVELKYVGTSFTELRTRARTIAAWLSGYSGSKHLIFDDETDKYYVAKIYSEVGLQNLFTVGQCTVQFECEPFAYGSEIITSQEMYSGNSTLSITSNGTIETAPIIEIEGRSLYTYSATFTRASVAYKQDFTQVLANLPRYETGSYGQAIMFEVATTNLFTAGESQGLSSPTTKALTSATYTVAVNMGAGSIALSGGSTASATLNNPVTFTLAASASITFTPTGAVTKCQLETLPCATSWQIGGTARAAEVTTIPTAGVLFPTEGDITIMAYENGSGNGSSGNYIFDTNDAVGRIALYKLISANRVYVYTYGANRISVPIPSIGWHRWSLQWNGAWLYLWLDGQMVGSYQHSPTIDLSGLTTIYLGSRYTSVEHWNGILDDLCISSIARTDAEMATRGASVEPLPVDNYTTAKMDCDGNLTIYGAVPGVTTATETLTTNPTITIGTASITYSGTLTYDEKLTIDNDKMTMYIGAVNALGSQSGSFLSLSTGANTVTYSDVGSNRANVTVTYADRWL